MVRPVSPVAVSIFSYSSEQYLGADRLSLHNISSAFWLRGLPGASGAARTRTRAGTGPACPRPIFVHCGF